MANHAVTPALWYATTEAGARALFALLYAPRPGKNGWHWASRSRRDVNAIRRYDAQSQAHLRDKPEDAAPYVEEFWTFC
jgi:hypothetical protein